MAQQSRHFPSQHMAEKCWDLDLVSGGGGGGKKDDVISRLGAKS